MPDNCNYPALEMGLQQAHPMAGRTLLDRLFGGPEVGCTALAGIDRTGGWWWPTPDKMPHLHRETQAVSQAQRFQAKGRGKTRCDNGVKGQVGANVKMIGNAEMELAHRMSGPSSTGIPWRRFR